MDIGTGQQRVDWRAVALLAAVAQLLFSFRLGIPSKLVFDEVHYVPAARALLSLSGPVNIEHPLFGKELIAFGIAIFGDNPIGWRALSTLAGTATVLAVYAIALGLTGRGRPALFAGVLALTGNTVFVQARIAMLDGFMAAQLAGGLACLLWAVRGDFSWRRWLAGAVLLGLAVATKWTAAPYLMFASAGLALLGRGDTVRRVAVLGAVSVATYFATFLPAFFYNTNAMTLTQLIPFQLEMYARQTQVLPPHTYQSSWWSWPLMERPIWYFWEPSDGAQRGILMVANPALAWGGLIAVAACLWIAWGDKSKRLLAAPALWLGSLAMWAAVPKSLGFFYYYYPSTVWLAVVIAVTLDRIGETSKRHLDEYAGGLAIGLFTYFWPVLSAAATTTGAFHHWTWFESWV